MQSTHWENQSSYIVRLKNEATQGKQLSTRIDPSIIEIFFQQQDLQKDTDVFISQFFYLNLNTKMTIS